MRCAADVPCMPEDPIEDPDRYAQCMRLLWLAASMKSFDVVVCLLPSDEENTSVCELIGDMVPMLQYTRKRDPSPPQVVVALSSADCLDDMTYLSPLPLVIPRAASLTVPALICEVLHPAAHWSGSLDSVDPSFVTSTSTGSYPDAPPIHGELRGGSICGVVEHVATAEEQTSYSNSLIDANDMSGTAEAGCRLATPATPSAVQWKTAAEAFVGSKFVSPRLMRASRGRAHVLSVAPAAAPTPSRSCTSEFAARSSSGVDGGSATDTTAVASLLLPSFGRGSQ